jgi:Haem-binding domain
VLNGDLAAAAQQSGSYAPGLQSRQVLSAAREAAIAAARQRLLCSKELGMGLAIDKAVTPWIAQNDARGRNAPYLGITPRLIAGAIALTLAMTAGCSSNSHNIAAAPPPAAANSWTAFSSNPQVVQILASSCFDCHSEAASAAWYVKIAPSYWWSGSARENLNFTAWQDYDEHRRNEEIQAIERVVNRGEMPPWDYTVFHPAAELSNQQKDLVSEWALSHVEALPAH